jgi:hypothetical protein
MWGYGNSWVPFCAVWVGVIPRAEWLLPAASLTVLSTQDPYPIRFALIDRISKGLGCSDKLGVSHLV